MVFEKRWTELPNDERSAIPPVSGQAATEAQSGLKSWLPNLFSSFVNFHWLILVIFALAAVTLRKRH